VEEVNLRRSRLELRWNDLLNGEEIAHWVSRGERDKLKTHLPTQPGIYRWLCPSEDSGTGCAYVGESGNLRTRISEYLDEAWTQIRESRSSEDDIELSQEPEPRVKHPAARYIDPAAAKEALENRRDVKVEERYITDYYEVLERCLKASRRWATIRVGAQLAWKHDKCGVQLQMLRVEEEEWFHGVEVSAQLLNEKVGRVFLEHWAIRYTERNGYTMLNCNSSTLRKVLYPKRKSGARIGKEKGRAFRRAVKGSRGTGL
jgi:hypothetical protein